MEGEHVLQTMLILLSLSPVFTEAYPTPPARFTGTPVASGRCDTEHVRAHVQACSLLLGRVGSARKTLHPRSERDKCLSGKVSMSDGVCVFVWACERKRESELRFLTGDYARTQHPPKKLQCLLLIRGGLSLYFRPNHLHRKPQENARLKFLSAGSHQLLLPRPN